jgi:Leucine-rich repeat (LRR) protein
MKFVTLNYLLLFSLSFAFQQSVVAQQSCRTRDSLALVDLYNATDGANWTRRANWLTSNPIDTWYGITLNAQGCVTIVSLSNNKLSGSLPNLNLQNLQDLTLSSNKLTGSIPNFNLPNLLNLTLQQNQLTGSIPNFNLPNLQTLLLPSNQLTGSIPNFNLPNLLRLSIGFNQLTGSVPNFNLPNLQILSLTSNQLTGSIPSFNLPNLSTLDISNNQLTGSIPNFNLPNLKILNLQGNRLTGQIPTLNFFNLLTLNLSSNGLTGSIPNFVLPSLDALNLGSNSLTGSIPNSPFDLLRLNKLTLSLNQLSGRIPNLKLIFPNLTFADLSNNRFDSCTAFTNLASFNTSGLILNLNRLTHDDIIPNISQALTIYDMQDSILVDTTISKNVGDAYTIDLKIDGALTTSTYEWMKDGLPFLTTTTNKLTFNSLAASDAGVYTCRVSNLNAPLLILNSRKITIQVAQSCRTRDSLALVNLYNATAGANWTVRNSLGLTSPWNLAQPMTTWYGVVSNSQGCVFQLNLANNQLVGTIPSSLGNLAELSVLQLYANNLSGTIPTELGNLSKVYYIQISNTMLSGSIPTSFGRLSSLTDLTMADNQLTGILPAELANLTKLKRIYLPNNQLTGSIDVLVNLPELGEIFLQSNRLTGSLPTSLGNLPKLKYVYLNDNQLSGSIPSQLANDTSLVQLRLYNNAFSGAIPNLTGLNNLTDFLAYSNNLTGSIPTTLTALPKLTTLWLANNQLTGRFQKTVSPTLNNITLSSNRLDSIETLSATVTALTLSGNKLTFDDIILNLRTGTYTPQDSFFVDTTITGFVGGPLSIDLKIDGALTTNQYKWFKNGVLQSAYTSNSNKLTINSLQATDAGVWTCQVTNTAAPLLTLQSRKITVKVSCAATTSQTPLPVTRCFGQTYTSPSGKIFTTTGVYQDTLKTTKNCDSILYTINLTIAPAATLQTKTPSVCAGQTYLSPSGKVLSATGTYRDTVKTTGGCDSILYTINLTVSPPTNAGALKFEGIFSNTSVELGSWFNYQIFSVEMWVKPGATQVTYADIIDNKHDTNINWVCQLWSAPNTYHFGANQAGVVFTLTADKWQHLALIKDSTRVSVYINGTLADTVYHPNPVNYDGNQFLRLGKHGYGGRNWSGEMDEVRLWRKALCQTEIQARLNCELSGTQNGLLGYYKFNQGTVGCDNTAETVLKDETGQHNGTLKNFSLKDTITNYTLGKVSGTCSNNVSNGLSTFYRDADGDSFGDLTKKIQACDRPSGYVSDSTDCNDNNVLVHAAAQPPTVSNITYCQNKTVSPLSANGTNLRWYITLSGGVGDSIAPTPTTTVIGTKSYFVTQSNGCESSRAEIKVTINSPQNVTNQILNPVSCTQYTSPSGKTLSATGIYRDSVKTINGCDSILYTINLTISPTATSQTLNPSVCTAYKSPSGKNFSITSTFRDTLKNINGCDSIRYIINLTVAPTATRQTLTPSVCLGQTYRSPSGKAFTTAGPKLDTVKNRIGCDSILFSINLTVLSPQNQQTTTQSVCKGDVFRGKILTRDTVFRDTIRSIALCDSVILTTPVKVNSASVNNLNLSLCAGGSATVNGIVYNAGNRSGQQILRAASAAGCDSIINITTSFVPNLSAIDDEYTIRDSSNVLNFNVLDNDYYSGNVIVTPLSKPLIGRLDSVGIGRFRYSLPPQANGTAGFSYRLCSAFCPNLCDTGAVKIIINRPRLNQDVSLGITPNCGCPNEKLLFPELVLNPDKYPANELTVVSRWGDVVFRAKPYKNDWSGANDAGQVLPAGTYYYIMRLDLANSLIKTGDITIYR